MKGVEKRLTNSNNSFVLPSRSHQPLFTLCIVKKQTKRDVLIIARSGIIFACCILNMSGGKTFGIHCESCLEWVAHSLKRASWCVSPKGYDCNESIVMCGDFGVISKSGVEGDDFMYTQHSVVAIQQRGLSSHSRTHLHQPKTHPESPKTVPHIIFAA